MASYGNWVRVGQACNSQTVSAPDVQKSLGDHGVVFDDGHVEGQVVTFHEGGMPVTGWGGRDVTEFKTLQQAEQAAATDQVGAIFGAGGVESDHAILKRPDGQYEVVNLDNRHAFGLQQWDPAVVEVRGLSGVANDVSVRSADGGNVDLGWAVSDPNLAIDQTLVRKADGTFEYDTLAEARAAGQGYKYLGLFDQPYAVVKTPDGKFATVSLSFKPSSAATWSPDVVEHP